MRPDLVALLPLDKYDAAKLGLLVAAGYPAIEPLLPALLQWLQDGNWPIARHLSPFLASIGKGSYVGIQLLLVESSRMRPNPSFNGTPSRKCSIHGIKLSVGINA
jgi:hypothetical protein